MPKTDARFLSRKGRPRHHSMTEAAAELQRLLEAEGQDHRIVLDLKEVNLVDEDAVRFL